MLTSYFLMFYTKGINFRDEAKKIMKSQSPDMSPKEIKKALIDADVIQADLARELKVSEMMISLVIHGKSVSDRVRRHIARRIGIDVKRIWPSAYLKKSS